MKVFDKNNKWNFVDDNNVFVGYESGSCCCEDYGYLLTREVPKSEGVGTLPNSDADGYVFDTNFFKEEAAPRGNDGGMVTFRLTKENEKDLYLTLYNIHNG